MGWFWRLFGKGIPFYTYIAVFYVIYVGVIALPNVWGGGEDRLDADGNPLTIAQQVEGVLGETLFNLPLVSGTEFPITWTTIFIVFCLLAHWIETIRATYARDISGNDWMSLVVTLICVILFISVPWFGTTAFLVIMLVGIGDLLLDRIVGQAVARRDFGGIIGTGG
ncbi:MAG: hypothetical protein AAFV62_00805 [Pseudomonadota bacterium]